MNSDYCKSIKSGLVDENGLIKLEFIKNSKYPQILANEMGKATPKLSSKQARSFYNVVNKIYLDAIAGTLSMNEAMVELTMLSSRVNDKFNKGSVPIEFKEFIEMNVDAVDDINTLKAFILHFEAICNNLKDVRNAGRNNTPYKSGGYKNNTNTNTNNNNRNNNYNNGGKRKW